MASPTPSPKPVKQAISPDQTPASSYGIEMKLMQYEEIMAELNKISCSIQKLDLDMKIVNGEDIEEDEYNKLKKSCEVGDYLSNFDGTIPINTKTDDFIKKIKHKKNMNDIASLMKILSFICPVLSIVNTGLLKQVRSLDIAPERLKIAAGICDGVITRISGILDNSKDIEENVDLLIKGIEAGAMEPVVTTGALVVTTGITIATVIKKVSSKAEVALLSKIDKLPKIFTVFLSLLSAFILYRLLLDETEVVDVNNYLTEFSEIANSNIQLIKTGGKRTKSKAKITKPPTKPPKTPTKPPKTPTKPPKTPTKPPKTPTKPPKTPKALPKKKK